MSDFLAPAVQEFIANTAQYIEPVRRAASETRQFDHQIDEAALAARKMELAIAEAARKVERAQTEAADAAQQLARGEIDATEAADRAAAAMRDVERADIAQIEAARRAAAAIDKQADQYRQLARDAALAAGAQQVASVAATSAFGNMEKAGAEASASITEGFSFMGVAAGAAIAALPPAAELAGGLIATGIGGGFAAAGLAATVHTKQVQRELHALKDYVGGEFKDIAKPFEQSWLTATNTARDVWDAYSEHLRDDVGYLQPALDSFTTSFGEGIVRARPGIDSLIQGFSALLRAVSAGLPHALGEVGDGLKNIGDELQQHPEDVARLINGLIALSGYLLQFVGYLMNVYHAMTEVAGAFTHFTDNVWALDQRIIAHIPVLGAQEKATLAAAKAAREQAGDLRGSAAAHTTLSAAQDLATQNALVATGQFKEEAQFLRLASQNAQDLKNSLDLLGGKTLTAREAARNYQQAIDDATKSLKENGKTLDITTEKGRANQAALDNLARTAMDQAVAFRDSKKSASEVAAGLEEARRKFISTSVAMGDTRQHAIATADKIFGVVDAAKKVPKGHPINYNVTGNAKAQLDAITWAANQAAGAMGRVLAASMGLRTGGPVAMLPGFADGGPAFPTRYPRGGIVRGIGTTTSDSNTIRVSRDEYVVNARATRANRALLDFINFGGGNAGSSPQVADGAGGGAPTIVINIAGNVLTERDLVEAVRAGLAQRSVWTAGPNGTTSPRAVN